MMNRFFTLLLAASCLTAVGQVPDYVPTEGLVAWYPFNGNADDESGNDNDGMVNGASLSSDRFNNSSSAFDFDGFNDFIDCGSAPSIQISGALTYSAWINLDTYTNFSGIIGRGEGTGASKAISMLMITTSGSKNLYFEISEGDALEGVSSPQEAIQPGTWIHVVGVWYGADADSMAVFIDGALSASAPSVTTAITGGTDPSDNLLKIGNRDRYSSGYSYGWFDGRIDDLGVWNRALSNDEITGLFLSEPPNPGCTDSAACNYDGNASFDDGSCIPSGCMDANACNFNSLAQCEGEVCDYSCCPGPGCCDVGTEWSWASNTCIVANPSDSNFDGCVQLNDLLDLLSAYGDCGAEESPWQCGDPLEYQGYDYETVQIGEQCWFAENCRYLPSVSPPFMGSEIDGAPHAYVKGYHGTSTTNAMMEGGFDENGALYNFEAINNWDLCPSGWHVSEATDLSQLAIQFGGDGTCAPDLKSEFWDGTNLSGFGARPNGRRTENGFDLYNRYCIWTSTSADMDTQGVYRYMETGLQIFSENLDPHHYGMSVRCIKDTE